MPLTCEPLVLGALIRPFPEAYKRGGLPANTWEVVDHYLL